jgi:hypothetical protein
MKGRTRTCHRTLSILFAGLRDIGLSAPLAALIFGCDGRGHAESMAKASPPLTSSTAPVAVAPVAVPRRPRTGLAPRPEPPHKYVAAGTFAAWTSPVETLMTRSTPIGRLVETNSHVMWVEPDEPPREAHTASVVAVAKARPHEARVVATTPVPAGTYAESAPFVIGDETSAYFFVNGPGATPSAAKGPSAYYDAALRVSLDTGASTRFSLPDEAIVPFNGVSLVASAGSLLLVGLYDRTPNPQGVMGARIAEVAAGKPARTRGLIPAALEAMVSSGNDAIVVISGEGQKNTIGQMGPDGVLDVVAERPSEVESVAVAARGAIAWTELQHDSVAWEDYVFLLPPGAPAPRFIARTRMTFFLQTNSTRVCWATFEPKQGPDALDRKGDPVGPTVLFVLCAPLTGGPVERALGPIDGKALEFAVDDEYLYWSEGPRTVLKRRAVTAR